MSNLYLLIGNEKYDKEKYVDDFKNNFGELTKGINYILVDKNNIYNLENEINTYPFGYDKKLIIVTLPEKAKSDDGESSEENTDTKTASKKNQDWLTDDLLETLNTIDESVTVLFIADTLEKSNSLRKVIEKNGTVVELNKKQSNELVSWITEMCKKYNIVITNTNIKYFVETCGNDKNVLKNELDKLIDYTGSKSVIDKEIIDKLCTKTSDAIIFDLTDYMGSRNKKKALESLEELLDQKEALQKIIVMIAKHFKNVLLAKVALNQRKNVAKELNIKEYPALKYSNQSKNYTYEELIKIYAELSKLDVDYKTGKMDLKIGLQKIICMI